MVYEIVDEAYYTGKLVMGGVSRLYGGGFVCLTIELLNRSV